MAETKSTTPAIASRYVHEIPATRDAPADVHIHYTTRSGTPTCPVDGEPMVASELPTAEARREAAEDRKGRTLATRTRTRAQRAEPARG